MTIEARDHERLRRVYGARAALDRPLGDPSGVAWRVNREAVTMLGGGRALLMQVAHPLVAAGVAAHSRFQQAPIERLTRTLELMLTIAFADGRAALAALH